MVSKSLFMVLFRATAVKTNKSFVLLTVCLRQTSKGALAVIWPISYRMVPNML